MHTTTPDVQSKPGFVAPVLVAWVLTLSDEELDHRVGWYLEGCVRATYGSPISLPRLEPSFVRERALRLRPSKILSMNEIFSAFDLLEIPELTSEQSAQGAVQLPVELMETFIESKLAEKAYLEEQEEGRHRDLFIRLKRRSRKSKEEKRGRYLRKRGRKAARKVRRNSRKV